MILTDPRFWNALRESGSLNETRGMLLHELKHGQSTLNVFTKSHSYGEYIFDWSWAEAYREASLPYYPKLTSMVPFTPATAPHFLGPDRDWPALLAQCEALLSSHSSLHFLFTTPEEQRFLGEMNYILRDSFQYHFFNEGYQSYDDFLRALKPKRAKHLRRERAFSGLRIERLTGNSLTPDHADAMYDFYLLTLEEKGAMAYLTRDFFRRLFRELPDNVLYVRAGETAGALFYYDDERLYGRYWGARTFVPDLHFELCYHQGIEFLIERKLSVFEAGAQGEHKIFRGFRPVRTFSAHRIRHPAFSRAIADYVEQERAEVSRVLSGLSELLPFKIRRG